MLIDDSSPVVESSSSNNVKISSLMPEKKKSTPSIPIIKQNLSSPPIPMLIRSDSFGYSRSFSPPSNSSPMLHALSPVSKSTIVNFSHSPNESFAGSFQESLITGRMANIPCTLFEGFYAIITYSYNGLLPAPKQTIPFNTFYYHVSAGSPTPYVGTIELEDKFRIPKDGLLQVTIFNPTQTPVKTFIVKYDLSDMPAKTKTFLRQTIKTKNGPSKLEYAIHFRIIAPKKNRYYLHKNVRVVFPHRKPDEKLEPLQTETVYPINPKFYPMR
jgi:hypothetical protein